MRRLSQNAHQSRTSRSSCEAGKRESIRKVVKRFIMNIHSNMIAYMTSFMFFLSPTPTSLLFCVWFMREKFNYPMREEKCQMFDDNNESNRNFNLHVWRREECSICDFPATSVPDPKANHQHVLLWHLIERFRFSLDFVLLSHSFELLVVYLPQWHVKYTKNFLLRVLQWASNKTLDWDLEMPSFYCRIVRYFRWLSRYKFTTCVQASACGHCSGCVSVRSLGKKLSFSQDSRDASMCNFPSIERNYNRECWNRWNHRNRVKWVVSMLCRESSNRCQTNGDGEISRLHNWYFISFFLL